MIQAKKKIDLGNKQIEQSDKFTDKYLIEILLAFFSGISFYSLVNISQEKAFIPLRIIWEPLFFVSFLLLLFLILLDIFCYLESKQPIK